VQFGCWTSGAVVTEEDARAVMAKTSALCSSRPRPVVVDISRMRVLEHKARTVFAGAWPLTRAAVVGASPVDRVIVDFCVARHSPVCPTKFFTSFSDAMTWLGAGAAQKMNVQRLPKGGHESRCPRQFTGCPGRGHDAEYSAGTCRRGN
jgi:hypothetical protein